MNCQRDNQNGFPLFLKRQNKYFHSTLKVASDDKFFFLKCFIIITHTKGIT